MAYNWDWKCKSGEIYWGDNCHNTLYQGNGFLIALNEWVEDGEEKYQVAWFMVDKDHAKRCLGLVKNTYDMFEGNVDKIILYKDHCSNWKDIVDMFTKTQPNIVIEIYPTERKEVA